MQKFRHSEIKPFEFSDLQGTHVIEKTNFKPFEFGSLNGDAVNSQKISEEEIRSERKFAEKNDFKFDDVVRDYRGLSRQEHSDLEEKIQAEVKKRIENAYQDAYKEGLEKGRVEGRDLIMKEMATQMSAKVESFGAMIDEVQSQSNIILENNKSEAYEFIKRFTKWIILKEIDEKVYLEKLFEKLVLELNAKKNLIVKIGKNNFSDMPEIIKNVESRVGQLSNVRIEIVPEIGHPGIILESENGLIDGSIEGVFQNIDKIFEQVVQHE